MTRIERVIVGIPPSLSLKPRPAAVGVEDSAAEFREFRQDYRMGPRAASKMRGTRHTKE
jgi:hypothetical protein